MGRTHSQRSGPCDHNTELLEAGTIREEDNRYLFVRHMQHDAAKQPGQECEVLSLLRGDGCPNRGGPGLLFIIRHDGVISKMQKTPLMPGLDRAWSAFAALRVVGRAGRESQAPGYERGHDLVAQGCAIDPDGAGVMR